MEYKTVSLVIGSYTVPNTPEAISRAKDALLDDLSTAVKHWDIEQCLVETINWNANARHAVPDWLLEDLEDLSESRPSYTCAGCHPNEQHPDVDYCDNCEGGE